MITEIVISWRLRELEKHEKNGIWVTDLIRCPLKREFEERYPELHKATVFTPSTILGSLVHLGLENLLSSELNAEVEVRREKVIGDYKIVGRIDAIIGKVGVEIKSSRADIDIPYEHHVLQARIYNWLYDLEKTVLVYVTPDRFAEFPIEDSAKEEEILRLIVDKKAPKYDWECRYCHFSVICPNKRRK